jgi:hypothetical protein
MALGCAFSRLALHHPFGNGVGTHEAIENRAARVDNGDWRYHSVMRGVGLKRLTQALHSVRTGLVLDDRRQTRLRPKVGFPRPNRHSPVSSSDTLRDSPCTTALTNDLTTRMIRDSVTSRRLGFGAVPDFPAAARLRHPGYPRKLPVQVSPSNGRKMNHKLSV